MNYPAMRWAVEGCQLDGAAKPILFVIAYRADRDTGECWAGQRRIAREAGVSRVHVQRVMAELVDIGVLEVVENGSGTKPRIVRIADSVIEHQAFGSGFVEGSSTASKVVEGHATGEVTHNPSSSGHMTWPRGFPPNPLVATSGGASGHMRTPDAELVATSGDDSGHSHVPLSRENAEKGFNQGFELQGSKHVVDDADSTARAAGVVDAPDPPPSLLPGLERRGLRPNPRLAPKPEQQPRSREEQLAILERIAAEDEAKAKNGQEGKEPA
jgi:hypothetical protein